jgi:hypothetical protein
MFPPTPTPLPPAPAAPVVVSAANWKIWKFADDAIMVWQQIGPSRTQVFQVAVILVIVIAFIWLVMKWVQGLTKEGDQ